MTKSVFLLFSLLVLVACDGCAATMSRTTVVADAYPMRDATQQMASAVRISAACHVINPDGSTGMKSWGGSGVLVAPTVVLTAYHVVECSGLAFLTVHTADGQKINARVRDFAKYEDVARIDLDEEAADYQPISIGPVPSTGDSLCVASAMPDKDFRCGKFIRIRKDARMYTSILVRPGNSGSGMYDADGKLVGIVTHLMKCPNGQYCGGLASYARQWMP